MKNQREITLYLCSIPDQKKWPIYVEFDAGREGPVHLCTHVDYFPTLLYNVTIVFSFLIIGRVYKNMWIKRIHIFCMCCPKIFEFAFGVKSAFSVTHPGPPGDPPMSAGANDLEGSPSSLSPYLSSSSPSSPSSSTSASASDPSSPLSSPPFSRPPLPPSSTW